MKDTRFLKQVVLVNGLVPLLMLLLDGFRHKLGANPQEFTTRATGILTLMFLILSLAITPVRKMLGQPWLAPFRRTLGLLGFFYGVMHLLAYVWFSKAFQFKAILADVGKRPFIMVGMASFLLLLALAITSPTSMIRRLGGKRWNRLHRLAYVAAAGGALHFYMLVKADTRLPWAFAGTLGVFLAYRVLNHFLPHYTERKPARRPVAAKAK
jgi:DMSO/TMAO reductase YedYZ heme-binding membrane subunit